MCVLTHIILVSLNCQEKFPTTYYNFPTTDYNFLWLTIIPRAKYYFTHSDQ